MQFSCIVRENMSLSVTQCLSSVFNTNAFLDAVFCGLLKTNIHSIPGFGSKYWSGLNCSPESSSVCANFLQLWLHLKEMQLYEITGNK